MAMKTRRAAAKKAAARKQGAKKTATRKTTAKKATARKPARRAGAKSKMQMPAWLDDALSSTLGREALAAALVAGAAAAAAVLAKRGAGGKIKSAVSEASHATKEFADAAADAFVEVASGAVRSFLPGGAPESDDDGGRSTGGFSDRRR